MLPETKKLPLEEMNKLFTESPWFVGNSVGRDYQTTETSMLADRIKNEGLDFHDDPEQIEISRSEQKGAEASCWFDDWDVQVILIISWALVSLR